MEYMALGCMSGTSLDGIDCSLIKSDGLSFAYKFQMNSSHIVKNYKKNYSIQLTKNIWMTQVC